MIASSVSISLPGQSPKIDYTTNLEQEVDDDHAEDLGGQGAQNM